MSTDLNRAGMLLHIVSKARDWPNLRGLHDTAMAELEDMAKQAGAELAKARADAKAKADTEAAKVAAAKIEADSKAKDEPKQPSNGAQSTTEADSARRL